MKSVVHFSDRINISEEQKLWFALNIYYENYGKYSAKLNRKINEIPESYDLYDYLFILGNSRYERIILSSIYRNKELGGYEFFVKSYIQPKFNLKEKEFVDILRKGRAGIKEIIEIIEALDNIPEVIYLHEPLKNILLRPVGEEFINFLTLTYRYGKELIEIIGYPYIVKRPSRKFANELIKSIEVYHRSQGIYKPHVDYYPSRLSIEIKLFIAWWRRFLLYDYGIKTGKKVFFESIKCNRLPLGESIIEKIGGLEMPVLLNGSINPMPKHYVLRFINKIEEFQGGDL